MAESKLHVVTHPVVQAKLTNLRLAETSTKDFREGVYDIAYILGIEASRDLPQAEVHGSTPIAQFVGSKIAPAVGILPILRAGLPMSDALLALFPTAPVYHLGLFREKVSLQPVEYYSKLPENPNVDQVFLVDPLIATGGTVIAAMHMILDWGLSVSQIKLLVVLASKEGLDQVRKEFPDLEIWVGNVDDVLTSEGLISPGLGDAGDRLFNTVH